MYKNITDEQGCYDLNKLSYSIRTFLHDNIYDNSEIIDFLLKEIKSIYGVNVLYRYRQITIFTEDGHAPCPDTAFINLFKKYKEYIDKAIYSNKDKNDLGILSIEEVFSMDIVSSLYQLIILKDCIILIL